MTKIEQKEEEIALELEGLISKDNPNLLKSLENMMLEYKQLIREEDGSELDSQKEDNMGDKQ